MSTAERARHRFCPLGPHRQAAPPPTNLRQRVLEGALALPLILAGPVPAPGGSRWMGVMIDSVLCMCVRVRSSDTGVCMYAAATAPPPGSRSPPHPPPCARSGTCGPGRRGRVGVGGSGGEGATRPRRGMWTVPRMQMPPMLTSEQHTWRYALVRLILATDALLLLGAVCNRGGEQAKRTTRYGVPAIPSSAGCEREGQAAAPKLPHNAVLHALLRPRCVHHGSRRSKEL